MTKDAPPPESRLARSKRRAEAALESPRLPGFIVEIVSDRRALLGLLAACLAILAAGLDPHVLDPGMPRGRAMLRDDPALEATLMSAAIVQAGLILVGGAIADIWRSERLLQGALVGLALASVGASIFSEGTDIAFFRVVAWTCTGLTIPFAVGVVALLYKGTARATALGVLFVTFGLGTMLTPILATAFGPDGPEIQAFALNVVVALLAAWAVGRWMPDLPGARRTQRRLIVSTGLWAFGVIIITANLISFEPLPLVTGSAFVAAAVILRRRGRRVHEAGVHGRRVSAALSAGMVVGISQNVPLMVLPMYFVVVQGIDGFVSSLLIAPFAVGLLVAGPLAGWLLERMRPRVLLIAGVWALAIADLVFFVTMGPDTPYLVFIVPFLVIGAGFAIATVIRTAVIFAATPQELPASAAALNESSIGVGARIGAVFVILLRENPGGMFDASELDLLRVALFVAAIVAIVGGIVVTLLLGPVDPLKSVWEMREEREPAEGAT